MLGPQEECRMIKSKHQVGLQWTRNEQSVAAHTAANKETIYGNEYSCNRVENTVEQNTHSYGKFSNGGISGWAPSSTGTQAGT